MLVSKIYNTDINDRMENGVGSKHYLNVATWTLGFIFPCKSSEYLHSTYVLYIS